MKFKYMLRGLGIGIIITACAMGAYTRSAVADARVEVLKEYGLGDEPLLVDESQSVENTESQQDTEPVILRDEEKESEINSVLDEAVQSEEAVQYTENEESGSEINEEINQDITSENVIAVTPTQEQDMSEETNKYDGVIIQIEIVKGDDSGTVSRKLYNAGLVENAAEYDAFLMQHGYDKKINTGVKNIYAGDSWKDMAEKLTK